jgi:hypothetical protein
MYNNDELFIDFTHTIISLLPNQCNSRIFFSMTLTTTFFIKIRLTAQVFTTIGYAFFFKIPPFVSAQISKCGARGKVTQKGQNNKRLAG